MRALKLLIILIREAMAIKLLDFAMFVAPSDMELAIAKGISLTFPDLAKQTLSEMKAHNKEQGGE